MRSVPLNYFKPSSKKILTVPGGASFVDPFCYCMFRVCHSVFSVHCSPVVTCWERANPLTLLYVMLSCVFITFQYDILGLCFVALRPKSTAMVIAGRSVHLTTLFPRQA